MLNYSACIFIFKIVELGVDRYVAREHRSFFYTQHDEAKRCLKQNLKSIVYWYQE